MPSVYRVAPPIIARLVGALLVVTGIVVLITTVVVVAFDLGTATVLIPVVLGLLVALAAAATLVRRGWVVRLAEEGYRVQWVRGVGVPTARWTDVEDAVTTTAAGSPVVVLRLRSGATTTIPVAMLAGDRDAFVRDLRRHLQDGQGLRPY